jgi:uncharacterized membrane protein
MDVASWRQSKLLSVAFLLSLCVNLFVAGWFLGGRSMRHPSRSTTPVERFGEEISSSLSPSGAASMNAAFADLHQRFGSHEDHRRINRERLKEVLTAEPFSPDDYAAVSRRAREERDKERDDADRAVAKAIAQLSSDDRARLAAAHRHPRF